MNLKKRIISLFLSILLLSGGSQTQAISVKSLWNRYATKKTFAFLGIASLIAFSFIYRWNKKKKTDNKTEKPTSNNNSETDTSTQVKKNDYIITQVPVLQQSQDNGGGASCGYQSIKNFKILSEDLAENDSVTQNGQKRLKDSTVVTSYFSNKKPQGPWRLMVLKNRPECKIMNQLSKKFGKAFREVSEITGRNNKFEKTDKQVSRIRGIYRKAVSTIMHSIKNSFLQGLTAQYNLSNENYIIQDIIGLIVVDTDENGNKPQTNTEQKALQEFNSYLRKDSTVRKYIDFNKLRKVFKCTDQQTCITFDALIDEVKAQLSSSDKIGEWLDGDEIKMIIEQQLKRKQSNHDFNYTILDDTNNIGEEGFCLLTPAIKEKIKPNLATDKPYVHGIFIGTMKQSGDKGRSMGHWFVVVLHKNKDGKREYIIADSMNTNRVNDTKVKKVIDCIENNIK